MSEDNSVKPRQIAQVAVSAASQLAITVAAGIARYALYKASTTDRIEDTPLGTTQEHPTDDNADLQKTQVTGSETAASTNTETSKGADSRLVTAKTDGNASKNTTEASHNGAKASKTNAGATNISTEGLHTNV